MRKNYFLFGLIVIFFLITRLYKISEIPPSLYWDEASIGYNAYSVLQDGRDEWGGFLPVHFRAFGEFKLPVYIYSVAPFVKVFGLSALAVRLPAVFYSLGTIIIVYLLTKKITRRENDALLASFLFVVSPWIFIFSRTGYEATAGLFLFLAGIYFYIYDREKSIFYIIGTVLLIGSMYSYTGFRILSPLVMLLFGIINLRDHFRKNLVAVIFSLLIFAGALVPIARLFIYDAGFGRAESFALIPGLQQVYDLKGKPHLQIIFNRSGKTNWKANAETVVKNYFSHFSPKFLFISGDSNPRSSIQAFGELYWAELPLLLIGSYVLVQKKYKYWWLPFLGILIGPLPAAITNESPHALRSILMFPFFSIVGGIGACSVVEFFKKNKEIASVGLVLIFLFCFENYFANFIDIYSIRYSQDWQYGYKEIFTKYQNQFSNYNKIVVSDQYAQPYIFALFYLRYNPANFRTEVSYNSVDQWGFSTVGGFNNFVFKKVESSDLQKSTLVFATDSDRITNVLPVGEIKNLDGTVAFWVYSK